MSEAAYKPFTLTVHKYLPVALLYFFFNSVGLPLGLVYTSLLVPIFYVWLLRQGHRLVITKFVLVLTPFLVVHILHGAVYGAYAISTALLCAVYITVYTFTVAIKRTRCLAELGETLIGVNAALAAVGLLLKFTPFPGLMWGNTETITAAAEPMTRFRMLTYEPSYYATLMVPLALYAFFKFHSERSSKNALLLAATLAPLLMAYSFGVILGLALGLAAVHIFYFRRFILNRYFLVLIPVVLLVVFILQTRENTFVTRINNVLTGSDTSGNARTILSYLASYDIAVRKSLAWGVGLGQVKTVGSSIIDWEGGRLPCAIAETFAQFGIVGLALRLGLQVWLFFRVKLYRNYYRFALFTFNFIYQFTGSFLTNLAEYVIWILAFSAVFPEFNTEPAVRLTTTPSVSEGLDLSPAGAPSK